MQTVGGARRQRSVWAQASLDLILIIALAFCATSRGLAVELVGGPPVAKFVPNIGAPPSALDVAQDERSMIYLANPAGVQIFDGELWSLVSMPNGDTVTALRSDGQSRMYVGGHDLFGYFERDSTGQPVFHDLTAVFKDQLAGKSFGSIYLIRVVKEGVVFEGTTMAFMYRPGAGTGVIWDYPGRLGAIEVIHDELWMQFRGEGLRRLDGEIWKPIPGSSGMAKLSNALLPLPDGGVLSMCADGAWLEFIDGKVVTYPMPKGFPSPGEFNTGKVLKDGTLGFAGIAGALWLYDPRTQGVRSMPISEGPIIEMRVANDGGIIAATDLAVYHIGWPSDWTNLNLANGISGTVHRLRQWGDRWLALSNNGVYTTLFMRGENVVHFQRQKYTDYDGFDLLVADAHHAYLAENFKLLWVDEKQVIKTIGRPDLYPRLLVRSESHPDQIYVGTDSGLAILDATASGGTFRLDRGDHEETVTDIVEVSATEVLLGTNRHGVRRITLNPERTRIVSDQQFVSADGISYGRIAHASISRLKDRSIIASTTRGLFRYQDGHFTKIDFDGLELPASNASVLHFAAGPSGEWAYGGQRIFSRTQGDKWRNEEISNMLSGYIESIAFDGDNITLFGAANTILLSDKAANPAVLDAPTVRLMTVDEIGPDSEGQRFALDPKEPMQVADDFSIAFHFALPDFSVANGTQYQARLKGRDPSYSNWQSSTLYRYRHLPAGDYTFQAAARDRLGRVTETAPFHFVVRGPWYASLIAAICWVILGSIVIGALIYFAITWRTRVLTRQSLALEREISERTQELVHANDRLNDLAHRDILTGLANRALFETRLEQACAHAQRHGGRFAVLFVDLDQFKTINDSLGHEAGDRLLQEVSARLQGRLRVEDTLARWGGDEFMVLVEALDSVTDVTGVAQALLDAASTPIMLSTGTVTALSTSVGVSIYPDDSTNVYELIRNADTAMYSAKQRGGNQWCFYASEMTVVARERLEVLNGLRSAVAQGDFVLHYQPIADVVTNTIVGVEALIRWRRGKDQLVLPETFIAVAESTDLISIIGSWVIRTACEEALPWLSADSEFSLAINISPRQLRSDDLVATVASTLTQFNISPWQLTLEVTESSIAAVGESAKAIVNKLKGLGVRVALDDFGTGQSALASLKRFDFDALKIDRSFIHDIPMDRDDMEIAATIVAMGHTLGLTVIAEGVETEAQLEFLRSCKCDRYQGFFLSQAVPAIDMTRQLQLTTADS